MARSSSLKNKSLAYYNYLAVFAYYFTAVLSSSFGLLSYKMMAVILAITTTIIVLANFKRNGKTIVRVLCPMLLVAFIFAFGKPFYPSSSFPESSTLHQSELLALVGQVIPTMLLAVLVSKRRECQIEMIRATPLIGLVLSLVAIRTVLNPAEVNESGFIQVEGGLNYQTVSYMGAYAFAFIGFFIVCHDLVKWPRFVGLFCVKWGLYVLFVVDFVIVMLSGGRGGFVVMGFHLILFVFMYFRKLSIERKKSVQLLLIILLTILASVVFYVIQMVSDDFVALGRITGLLDGSGDSGRDNLRTMAIDRFMDSPIFGHTFGSVFYAIGDYSHFIFTDILVEAGIIGFLIFLYLLLKSIWNLVFIAKKTIVDYLWLVFFVDGIGQALFSGYYLANIPMWWGITFALCLHYKGINPDSSNMRHPTIVKSVCIN